VNLAMQRLLVGVTLLCGACVSTTSTNRPNRQIYEGRTALALHDIGARMTATRILYVAEQHGDPISHRAQLDVARYAKRLGPVVLAIEWLPASSQPTLDAWIRGDINPDQLAKRLKWKQTWGHSWKSYAPIFHWSRRHQVPMIALNAEAGLARAVARGQVGQLSAAKRYLVPPLRSGNQAHRAYFDSMMREAAGAHAAHFNDAMLASYYRAQLVWDETMAQRVGQTLNQYPAKSRVLVFAGEGHVLFRFGVPERVAPSYRSAVIRPISSTPEGPEPTRAGRVRADWLWLVSESASR